MFLEYVQPTIEDTLNPGSISIYNKRTRKLYDDVKDFLVLHYMGGRKDSEFWKHINSGATQTEFVKELLAMIKHRTPTVNDFPHYQGSAGWPLYSYVMEGINLLDKTKAGKEIDFDMKEGNLYELTQDSFYHQNNIWRDEDQYTYSYKEFIDYFRGLRIK